MKNPPTLKEFVNEFKLRNLFNPALRHLEIKKLKDFKNAVRLMSN
jgi:hypothetical protein